MCRIAGFWDKGSTSSYHKTETLAAMRDSLSYGGPDAAGIYEDESAGLYLGHRRLSILDLSDAGTQPMYWNNWVVVFNGEIYNFKEVKTELEKEGYTFKTDSDTEVLLKGFEKWGREVVKKFRGMFSFALWNKETKTLTLCRDRVGVKPLFVYQKNGLLMFASELKAFHQHPHFDKTIDEKAVSVFLQQGYIHSEYCIYKNVKKIKPGSLLEIHANGTQEEFVYWDVENIYQNNKPFSTSENELSEQLEKILTESFMLRMVADVPVGMFLSGGIDSSLVTSIIQKNSSTPVKTFTIGFDDPNLNEAHHASAIAKYLGTQHTELYCTEKDFKEVLPELPSFYDEPFGDSSAIPTYLVSRLAKEQVTVSLSADGGDELFGGYTKYEAATRFFPKINRLPKFSKNALLMFNPDWVERNAKMLPIVKNYKGVANKFYKLQQAAKAKNLTDFFNLSSVYIGPDDLKKLYPIVENRFSSKVSPHPNGIISYLGMIDVKTYLEGDIMTKVDRACMQVALEGREPFLDHKVIEFAMGLPDELKIKNGVPKYMLRQLLYRYVPKEMIERPKQGFSIPIDNWLRTILKDNLLELANDKIFIEKMNFSQSVLKTTIENFLSQKKFVNGHFVWFLYCLYEWDKKFK